ncbi:M20 family metallopeptidase [Halorubrum vacuolatum]|uniref:Acetylornithine deacetylase n=1 Tax=Halorubrum vacuolatum TaxID=63740 RepID=A0A238V9X8_HALVU|nr:M20/M25/M40 family metallo-hydrolase [Halorubrum vacuolatum]SNR31242.1 acetylornithine deacetylase [Halorubrum vacuolatum]
MEPVSYLEQLMKIESHETVSEIQNYLLETIANAELDETGCIHATKEGAASGPELVFNTHMDVVSPHIAFSRDDETIYGRGACDAKGSLAAMVAAFDRIDPERGTITLLVSPDEETTQRGLYEYLSDGISADFAIVGEPTGLDVCYGARGHYDLLIELSGESAHGGTPESGINATMCAARAIHIIRNLRPREDDELGRNDFTPTIIEGGNRPNQVPEYAKFVVDYRTIPGESREDATERIRACLQDLDCDHAITQYDAGSSLDSFKTDPANAFVERFTQVASSVTNRSVETRPFEAATEAAFFSPSMPVIVFGPGLIHDGTEPIAHSDGEYVPIADVESAAAVLSAFLEQLLSN